MLRNGNGGEKGFFDGPTIGGVLVDQDFTPRTKDLGIAPMCARSIGDRDRLFQTSLRRAEITALSLRAGRCAPQKAIENDHLLFTQ